MLLFREADVTSCVESSATVMAGLPTSSVSEEVEDEEMELPLFPTAATLFEVPPKVLVVYGVEVVSSVETSDIVTVGLTVMSTKDTPCEPLSESAAVDSGTTVLVVYGVDVLKTVETAEWMTVGVDVTSTYVILLDRARSEDISLCSARKVS